MKMETMIAIADQSTQDIIENRRDELDAFLLDGDDSYLAAKALVSFVLANHFALKTINEKEQE